MCTSTPLRPSRAVAARVTADLRAPTAGGMDRAVCDRDQWGEVLRGRDGRQRVLPYRPHLSISQIVTSVLQWDLWIKGKIGRIDVPFFILRIGRLGIETPADRLLH